MPASLSAKYANVLEKGGPDYSPDYVKFAYIFRYTTAHADFLHTIIRGSKEIAELANKDAVVVSCIGGGPGSDILGFVKYLLPLDPKPHMTFFLLDKDQSWGDAWWNLDQILASDLRTSNNFIPVDVTDSATWTKNKAYLKADIYTLIYFLSEIFSKEKEADKFLRNTFSKMKPGAVLIVLDFHYGHLEKLALRPIAVVSGANANESNREQSGIIRRQFRGADGRRQFFEVPF